MRVPNVFYYELWLLGDSDWSQKYWDGNQEFYNSKIALFNCPDGSTDLLTGLKGPVRQVGYELEKKLFLYSSRGYPSLMGVQKVE